MSSQQVFEIGRRYSRQTDIHGRFGGQEQGGISTPRGVSFIALFTSDSAEAYGYSDSFQPNGSFWYTGEGQVGDMKLVRGNLAIAEHARNGKTLYLFEYVKKGIVRFLGEFEYLGHHTERRMDRDRNERDAIVFELGFVSSKEANSVAEPVAEYESETLPKNLSLTELRRIACSQPPKTTTVYQRRVSVARRAKAIKRYALVRAAGKCEGCRAAAPFLSKDGPFLEVHHVHRLGDGGPDHPTAVVALCPNCHRRIHHAVDGETLNNQLIEWLRATEAERE